MSAEEGVFVGHSLPTGVERMPGTVPFVPGIPLRLEISSYFPNDQVSEDPKIQKQWTLFVLGLEKFMALPVDKTYSYFQIAGIHGFPSLPWADCPKGGFYCHHGEIDFSTWHRPYLLLFEVSFAFMPLVFGSSTVYSNK
jgi:tyrosinase